MNPPLLPPELADHLEAFCLGELTHESAARLEALVMSNPTHCEHLVRFALMDAAAMRFEAIRPELLMQTRELPSPAAKAEPPRPVVAYRARPWHIRSLAVARLVAAVLFVTYFGLLSWDMLGKRGLREQAGGGRQEAGGTAVATITGSENARWLAEDASASNQKLEIRNQKSEISPGKPLSLAAGIVALQLKQGVQLVVEGPARWSVVDDNRVQLDAGKLFATVPHQAIGFTVRTPTTEIVDLGTEFGVEVGADGETDVSVVKGEITTTPLVLAGASGQATPKSSRLTAGQSIHISRSSVEPGNPNAQRFVRAIPATNQQEVKFSPGDEPGLRLWLRGDLGVVADTDGNVERWLDQSPRHFDAIQSVPGKRPKLLSQWDGATLPTVQFDGVKDFLFCDRGLDFDLAGDMTILVAVTGFQKFQENVGIFSIRSRGGVDWDCLDGLAIRQGMMQGTPIVGAVQASNRGWTMPGFNSLRAEAQVPQRGAVIISVSKQNGVATLRINGNTQAADEYQFSPVADQPSSSCLGYFLGARGNAGGPQLFGAVGIAEVLVIDRALSASEKSAADAYLLRRYVDTESNRTSPVPGGKQR